MLTIRRLAALMCFVVTYVILYSSSALALDSSKSETSLDIQPTFQVTTKLTLEPVAPLYRSAALRKDFNELGNSEFANRNDELGDDFFDKNNRKEVTAESSYRKRSAFTAVALSTLLPGAGQWYIGNKREARLFLGAEAGIWASFAALKVYAGWKQDDVERFATRHAGVNGIEQDEQFFRQLTFYSSREEYNSLGRAFNPDLPFIDDTPETDWNWDSQESRLTFRQLFNDQNSADRNADFMFIAAVVNRLTSAALAWRSSKKHNNRLGNEDDVNEFGSTTSRKKYAKAETRTTLRLVQPARGRNASDGLMLAFTRSF